MLRFTLAQLMAGIAALAVMFAFLPMGAAIALSCLITCLLLLERSQLSSAGSGPRGEVIGCVSCIIGFLVGSIVGVISTGMAAAPSGIPAIATGFWCGLFGAAVAGMVGHFIAVALSQRRSSSPVLGDLHRRQMLAEIDLTEELMAKAEAARDYDVQGKLAEYKAGLERDLGL